MQDKSSAFIDLRIIDFNNECTLKQKRVPLEVGLLNLLSFSQKKYNININKIVEELDKFNFL